MTFPISSSIASLHQLSSVPTPTLQPAEQGSAVNFQQMLFDSLGQTNQLQHQAEANIESRLLGEEITSAEVYTSMRKADMAMKMMVQVRNKLIDAYQEIQQMRI